MNSVVEIERKIIEIESKYQVERIKYRDIYLWPFLRNYLKGILSQKTLGSQQDTKASIWAKIKKHLKHIHYTKFSLFNKKDVGLVFVSNNQARYVDGKCINQLTCAVERYLGVFIPVVQVNDQKPFDMYNSKYIDEGLLVDMIHILGRICRINKGEIEGRDKAESILNELNLDIDIYMIINMIVAGIRLYTRWFKRIRPRCAIIECYYDIKMCAIYAAKDLNIPTIELQHGLINGKSFEYNILGEYNKTPFPDWLLCHGKQVVNEINSGRVYHPDRIIPIGSMFLDRKKTERFQNKMQFKKKYDDKNCVWVTIVGQSTIDDRLVEVIQNIAQENEKIQYIYSPRNALDVCDDCNYKNLHIENDLDVYTLMQCSDVTISVYSTCVTESLYLGTPVILVNIYGLASFYYEELSNQNNYVTICDDDRDIINRIMDYSKVNREDVEKVSALYFEPEHYVQVERTMNRILGGIN